MNDAQRIGLSDGTFDLRVAEPECDVSLTWHGWGPMFAYTDDTSMAAAHFEGAGTVSGAVRLGDDSYEISAVAFRDRSWGPRDYGIVLAHRWFAGKFGEDLSFSAVTLMFMDGRVHREGVLFHDGRRYQATDVDVVVHQEADAFSHRGGMLRLSFDDHEDFGVSARAVDGVAFPIAGGLFHTVDTLCVAESAGRQGFCNVEVSNNRHNADPSAPIVALAAAVDDNLTRRP